jgi:hypothetical protein
MKNTLIYKLLTATIIGLLVLSLLPVPPVQARPLGDIDIYGERTWSGYYEYHKADETIQGELNIIVHEGAKLTIEPGTIVKFGKQVNLIVYGTLICGKLGANPVVMTSLYDDSIHGNDDGYTDVPSANAHITETLWGQIQFLGSSASESVVENTIVEFGGLPYSSDNSGKEVILIRDSSPRLQGNWIQHNRRHGIRIESNSSVSPSMPVITENNIVANGNIANYTPYYGGEPIFPSLAEQTAYRAYALSMDVASMPTFGDNYIARNSGNGVEVRSGTLRNNRTWGAKDLVYILSGNVTVSNGSQLVINPGVVVKAEPKASLIVDGRLTAVGDFTPIEFTSFFYDAVGPKVPGTQVAPLYDPFPIQTGILDNPNDTDFQHVYEAAGTYKWISISPTNTSSDWYWGYIQFSAYSDSTSRLANSNIFFGGNTCGCADTSYATAAIRVIDSSPKIDYNLIGFNYSDGISVQTTILNRPAQPKIFENMLSQNRGRAIVMDPASHPIFSGNYDFNSSRVGVYISGDVLHGASTWDQMSVVYVIDKTLTIALDGDLTISKGMVVKFGNDASLMVNGKLTVNGEAANRVYFTSIYDDEDPQAGGDTNGDLSSQLPDPTRAYYVWGRIGFTRSSGASSKIENAVVRYGGNLGKSGPDEANAGVIDIVDASPVISQVDITDNYWYGLSVASTSPNFPAQPTLQNLLVKDNKRNFGVSMDASSHPIVNNITYSGNKGNAIEIREGFVTGSTRWDQSQMYAVTGDVTIQQGAQLAVAPGTIIKMGDNASLLVKGVIRTEGTKDHPVTFTSIFDDSIGSDVDPTDEAVDMARPDLVWGQIKFEGTGVLGSRLEYTNIYYAGNLSQAGTIENNGGAVEMLNSRPILRGVTIAKSYWFGMVMNTFDVNNPAKPRLLCVNVENNHNNFGLYNANNYLQEAKNVWWGNASGPYHATSNPGGTGQVIVGQVDFTPWATAHCDDAPLLTFTLSGRIVDGGKRPLAGVKVWLNNTAASTITDANGAYTFTGLPEGYYSVKPELDQYVFAPSSQTVRLVIDDVTLPDFMGLKILVGKYLVFPIIQ